MSAEPTASEVSLHLGYAEQGKLLALQGRHPDALRHYREAIRLAVANDAPPVFPRHYSQCVVESLERIGAWEEVLRYCDAALAHYAATPPGTPLAKRDRASHHERRGVILLKAGRPDEARGAFEAALADPEAGELPLARTLLGWVRGRFHIDARRIEQEQVRHGWFVVRRDAVDPARAIPLPAHHPV